LLKLGDRLAAIARRVSVKSRVLDVGCDHGYIPVYLAQNGVADALFASDVNVKPLERGREIAREYGVSDKITFLLADGVPIETRGEVDTVIISGMGGETIAGIIAAAPWLSDGGVSLILQPQTKYESLVSYLSESGFEITDCELASEERGIYLILCAVGGRDAPRAGVDVLQMLFERRDPLLGAYLDRQIKNAQKAFEGLARSGSPDLSDASDTLTRLKNMRGGL
jgi:tRNA (adenine22-N1)-methyltransferase